MTTPPPTPPPAAVPVYTTQQYGLPPPPSPSWGSVLAAIPARYAKFVTSLAGELIVYLQLYGATWHLVPAVTMIGAALGVLGVPNVSKS